MVADAWLLATIEIQQPFIDNAGLTRPCLYMYEDLTIENNPDIVFICTKN